MAERVYNEHHPSRELFPDFTLRLRSWMHLTVRRLEQLDVTQENFVDLCNMAEAVDWVKKLMFVQLEERDAKANSVQSREAESTRNNDPD